MDNDLESKQFYLRSEILEKGYDAEEFFKFLIGKKGDEGGDLNNWTMFDLKIVVSEFQVSHQSQNEPVPLPSQDTLNQYENNQQQNLEYPSFQPVPIDNNTGYIYTTDNVPPQENIGENVQQSQQIPQEFQKQNDDIIEIECFGPDSSELSTQDVVTNSLAL